MLHTLRRLQGQHTDTDNNVHYQLLRHTLQQQFDKVLRHLVAAMPATDADIPVVSSAKNPPGLSMFAAPWQMGVRLSRPTPGPPSKASHGSY